MNMTTYQSNKLQINPEIYTFNALDDFAEFETEINMFDNNHCNNCKSKSDDNPIHNNPHRIFNTYNNNLTCESDNKQQQKQFTHKRYDICSVIKAYVSLNFNQTIQSNIINLCALFCTILDKFDIKTCSNTKMYGLNNTIAVIKSSGYVLTNNIIRPTGKFRWSFKITDCFQYFQDITFSLLANNKCITCHSISAKGIGSCAIGKESCAPFGSDRIFHIYFDADENVIVFKNKYLEFFRTKIKNKLNETDSCKLRIFVGKQAKIEMVGFESYNSASYSSNLLMDNNRIKYIKYGLCSDDIEETLMYFTKSLNIGPIARVYQKEYLYILMECKLFDNIYEFVYEYNVICSKLWEDESLKQMDLLFEAGYICDELGDINNAIKYYKMCIDYYGYNKYKTETVCISIANAAQIYINMNDSENAIEILKLLERFIDIADNNEVIYGNNKLLTRGELAYDFIANSVYNNGAELFRWYTNDRSNFTVTHIKEQAKEYW